MSTSDEADPFEVLGVSREVDERELKKRYFALLRQFPPESHPVEFARVQRAWEVVSDPERRASHLAEAEPYEALAEPWRSRLREALGLLQTDRVDLARVQLATLLDENPDLDDARELLQQVLYNREQWAEAEVQLRELVARQPTSARYLSRLVLVLGRLDRHGDALAVAQQWVQVSQRKDPMAWVYVAETLGAQKRYGDALKVIDEGLAEVELKAHLVLTRLQLRLDMSDPAAAALSALERDLTLLERVAPRDDETRKAVSQRLQSMAALFFNRNRADEANALIKASRAFWSQSQAVQFPPFVDVQVDDLPLKSRQWLEAESKDPHIFRVLRRGRVADVLLALLVTAPAAVSLGQLLTVDAGWEPGVLPLWVTVFAVCGWLAVWAWRQVGLSFSRSHRRMVSVHGLYLLEVGLESLRAWPLVNFSDVRVVHHHTNGVYTNSIATLTFVKKKVNLSIRGQALAVKFAETLQGFRYRALQLLHGGMLEAEEGYDFIPHAFLVTKFVSPSLGRQRYGQVVRAGVVGMVVVALALVSQMLGVKAQHELRLAMLMNTPRRDQAATVFVASDNADDRRVVKQAFQLQLAERGPQLLAVVLGDAVHTQRLNVLLAALAATEFGGVRFEVRGEGLGDPAAFTRGVESGFAGERSWLAEPVVTPGTWKTATSVPVAVSLTSEPVGGVGIGPDGKAALQRLKGTVVVTHPADGSVTASLPVEVVLDEGEVLGLAGTDVDAVQSKALAVKLGALIADELGVGRDIE